MAGDFGIKVSQSGFDVEGAGDPNIYFSSSFPWLKIGMTDQVKLDSNSTVDIQHDLKYPPFALAYGELSGLLIGTSTDKKVTFSSFNGSEKIRYYIFLLPLNVEFTATTNRLLPVGQGAVDPNIGIKFAKRGKDITSNDLRDYTIHSGSRSPLLHKVIYQPISNIPDGDYKDIRGLEWKNELPYFPVYFAYIVKDGTFTPVNSIAQSPPKVNFDGLGTSFIRGIVINDLGKTDDHGCFVILKDPLDGAATTKVTF